MSAKQLKKRGFKFFKLLVTFGVDATFCDVAGINLFRYGGLLHFLLKLVINLLLKILGFGDDNLC